MSGRISELQDALEMCVSAMRKSVDVGCTNHLDACDDLGAFWHDALKAADEVLSEPQ